MTSLEVSAAKPALRAAPSTDATRWTASVSASVDETSRAWLSLEMSGLATPYQTLGWQRAAFDCLHPDQRPCIVSVKEKGGRTVAILPLVLSRRAGIVSASFPGGKHANYNMGLFDPEAAARITGEELAACLRTAAASAGIDLFDLRNQPGSWGGCPNPMLQLPHQKAASSAWRADLMADAEAFIRSLMSSESRKKLRHKERRLGEIGPVTYAQAVSPDEARGVLNAFLEQKRARFLALGIANPFDDPAVLRFLDEAGIKPLADGPPAPLSLFAMMAGGRILAVFGGLIHSGRFSGMFTSFDPDPAVSKYSPGDLLLLNLIRMMCTRGLTTFDLGTGEAAYKNDYCAVEEPLFDSLLPMTLKGRVASAALSAALRGKAVLKRGKAVLKRGSGSAEPLLRSIRRWRRRR
jgi:CelD/BcsL family acetyltransferase involved in cellulose biosynthesis